MVEAENNLLIFDYSISAEATVTFHAVEYSRDNCRSRIGHRTFLVTEIPFVLHQGPFQTKEDAVAMQKDVNETLTDDPAYWDRGDVDVRSRVVKARPESNWKGPPMAYLHDSMQTASFWIEYSVADRLEKSFHLLPTFKILTNIIKTLAEGNAKLRDSKQGQLWLTDRNIDDSVLRCLAPYNLPGFFASSQLKNGGSVSAPLHSVTPMHWPEFEKNILQTQHQAGRNSVVFGEKDWQHLIFNVAVISNVPVPEGVVIGKSKENMVYIYTVDLNSRTRTKRHEFTLKGYEAFVKREARTVDLVLVGVEQPQLDKIQANMITEKRREEEKRQERLAKSDRGVAEAKNKKASKWSSGGFYLPPASSHQAVVSKTRYIGPSTLPYSTLQYHMHPFFVVPVQPVSVDELASEDYFAMGWEHEFDICSFVTNLTLKSRVTGRNWSYLSAPLGYSTTSKRAEGIISRRMFRAGYTVLPTCNYNSNGSDQSENEARPALRKGCEDAFDEMEDLSRLFDSIHFEGGLNEPVHTQLISNPDMMTNLDFSSFYGALICLFKLDPCNPELWVTYETMLRELSHKQQRGAAAAATSIASQEIDTQPIAEFWHKKYKDFVQKSGKTPDQLDELCDWKQYPFANYIREFLLLRQSLQTLLGSGKEEDKTTPLSESRRKSIGEMVEFLKNTVSAAYGTIGFRGNRFFYLPLSTMTPILGRRLILESSDALKSILYPSMVRVMCVTDSLAYRFPREQRGAMHGFIERFKREHLERTYGKLLQIKTVETSHLLMTVRNNYALIRESDKKIEIRGLGPRKAETPPYIADLLTRVLQLFLLSNPANVPFENLLKVGDGEQTLSKLEREVLVDKLARAIEQACGEMQPRCTAEVPSNTAGNDRYFVYMTHGNALNRHFQFDAVPTQLPPTQPAGNKQKQKAPPISAEEQSAIDVHKTLGRVCGCVIECSGERGSIVSPCRPIPPTVWSSFYLDISFRQELISTLERLFAFEDIDEAICRCFPHLGRLATWNGKKVLPGSKQSGGRRSDGTRNTGKDAVKFIEAVSKLAFGEDEYENYVAPRLIAQRPNETDNMDTTSLENHPPLSSESAENVESDQDGEQRLLGQDSRELSPVGSHEHQGHVDDFQGGKDHDNDEGSDVWDDMFDDGVHDHANGGYGTSEHQAPSRDVVERDPKVGVPVVGSKTSGHTSNKKKAAVKKGKTAKKPMKAAPVQSIVEFMWKFELVCKTCNQASVRTFNDRGENSGDSNPELGGGDVAADFFKRKTTAAAAPESKRPECQCELCGGSIFGDFMQIDETANSSSGNTIFGLDVKLHCYTLIDKKHFVFTGEAALTHPFAVLRNNWQSLDRLKDGLVKILSQQLSTQSRYEERTTLGNLIAAGFISALTPHSRNQRSEELGLTRLYLDIVVGHLCNHPYMCL